MIQSLDSSNKCTQTFADRHIHGIAGVDFATSSISEITAAIELLARRRTTNVTASIPTVPVTAIPDILQRLWPLVADDFLDGIHLEGPFLARGFAGAHPHDHVLAANSVLGRQLLDIVESHQTTQPSITMMTVAPETPGFSHLVHRLLDCGIIPALGHTAATAQQMRDGIQLLYDLTGDPVVITHCHNAMPPLHHRDPGPLLAIFEAAAADMVRVQLIADGFHLDYELISWWLATYPGVVRLVSDASAATLPTGYEPLSAAVPRLGEVTLMYPTDQRPVLADGHTLASGGKDLLAIHDALVDAGFEHERICAAMRH